MAGAYQTGIYRNVLKECGYDETAIGERLEQTFETIFYGTEAQRFYHEAGGDMAYLEDTGNHDVRTEGMSYGMMVCVQMDKKAEFDRLWKWVRTYMYIPAGPCRNYLPGPAARMERTMQRDRHRTEKSILPWHCFLHLPAGGTEKVFLLTAKRQKQSCGNVFTKGSLDIRENLCGSLPII